MDLQWELQYMNRKYLYVLVRNLGTTRCQGRHSTTPWGDMNTQYYDPIIVYISCSWQYKPDAGLIAGVETE